VGKKEETMFSIRGRFHNGSAQPLEPVEGREGQPVIITFLEDNPSQTAVGRHSQPCGSISRSLLLRRYVHTVGRDYPAVDEEAEWASLRQLLEECKIDTEEKS